MWYDRHDMSIEEIPNQTLINNFVAESINPSDSDPKAITVLETKIIELQKTGKLTDQQRRQLFELGVGLSMTLDDGF